MMTNNQPEKPAKKNWAKILLIISLGLNVLVVGVVGGAVLRGGPPDRVMRDREIGVLGLRIYFRAMDADQRADLRNRIAETSDHRQLGRAELKAHLTTMAGVLSAEPFDLAAVEAVLAAQVGKVSTSISNGHQLLLEQIDGLSKSERAAMAKRLTDPSRWHRRDFKRRN